MVIVADDIALDNFAQPRGIAGTLFVHKVAGSHAEAGAPLERVAAEAARAAKAVKSLGIATTVCTIPGQQAHARLAPGQAELGLGIHGEPGVERIELPLAAEVAEIMAERLGRAPFRRRALWPCSSTISAERRIWRWASSATRCSRRRLGARAKYVVGPARLMTALDMKGVSVSVLPLDEALASALDRRLRRAGLAAGQRGSADASRCRCRAGATSTRRPPSDEPRTRETLTAMCDALLKHEAELNALDARVGDGDTGTTFATAARTVLSSIDALPLAEHDKLCAAISKRLSEIMGGTSGVLLSIFAAAAGRTLATGASWPASLREGRRPDAVLRRRRPRRSDHARRADTGGRNARAGRRLRQPPPARPATAPTPPPEWPRRTPDDRAISPQTELKGVADPGAVAIAVAFEAAASILGRGPRPER